MKKTKFGFTVGEKVIDIIPSDFNYKKVGKVIGFHAYPDASLVFVSYLDGTYGVCIDGGKCYLKVKDIEELQ